MINPARNIPEDTEENRQICRQYCKICPNYKAHSLEKYQPTELFCVSGNSSCPDKKKIRCFCTGCEIFTKYHLRVGYFCDTH
ncbi:MAG: DUF2769 domain-containing protein [Methanoregula sp.]|nr:DUF2769 domain-containing protein [Methanoregula sp.]MDP2797214.1 DUF2769 domain-containing protein [Methanoregula sp.]